jgi:hypothetical protein
MNKDMVNSPDHYNQGKVECIDAIREALGEEGFVAYCRGNALKYNWRAGHKNDGIEDLKKAVWYIRMAAGDDPRADEGYGERKQSASSRQTMRDIADQMGWEDGDIIYQSNATGRGTVADTVTQTESDRKERGRRDG